MILFSFKTAGEGVCIATHRIADYCTTFTILKVCLIVIFFHHLNLLSTLTTVTTLSALTTLIILITLTTVTTTSFTSPLPLTLTSGGGSWISATVPPPSAFPRDPPSLPPWKKTYQFYQFQQLFYKTLTSSCPQAPPGLVLSVPSPLEAASCSVGAPGHTNFLKASEIFINWSLNLI